MVDICPNPNCNSILKLEEVNFLFNFIKKISKNFAAMKRDAIWAVCPSCENTHLPKFSVTLGVQLGKFGHFNVSLLYNIKFSSQHVVMRS